MSAPMSGHSGATLAAAVTEAGGLGLFGGMLGSLESLEKEIDQAQALLGDKPFGIGFITFLLESSPELFELALDKKVPVLALSLIHI